MLASINIKKSLELTKQAGLLERISLGLIRRNSSPTVSNITRGLQTAKVMSTWSGAVPQSRRTFLRTTAETPIVQMANNTKVPQMAAALTPATKGTVANAALVGQTPTNRRDFMKHLMFSLATDPAARNVAAAGANATLNGTRTIAGMVG